MGKTREEMIEEILKNTEKLDKVQLEKLKMFVEFQIGREELERLTKDLPIEE